MDARRNNFDLLRLAFASAVVLWHVSDLSRAPELQGLGRAFSADFGVKGFFVVSGYLVVMSFENSGSLTEYALKRARRIYPAYFTIVCLCALAGAALSSLPLAQYLSPGLLRYLAANLAFLNFLAPTLPGVFAGNPWQEVNGALWTLKIEVMFYALVPLIVLAWRRLGPAPVLGSLYALSVLYGVLIGLAFESSGRMLWLQLQRQLPGQLTYFLVGAALYAYRDRIGARWSRVLVVGAVCFVTDKLAGSPLARPLLEPLWMGIAVVFAATGLPFLCNFARFGDLSYGLYIVHFPIIQAAVAAGWFAREPWLAFVAVMVLTVAGAFLSWHLVEKPFLARRSHYRLAEQGAG